jgi:predicted nucleic acid-binding Zn finger protein
VPTFTEVLPGSKTNPHRAMKYSPVCSTAGILELTDRVSHVRYAVDRLPYGGFRLTKQGGEENYVVTPATCECRGFIFGRGQLCKHALAVHAILANGWMDEAETVADKFDRADELDAYYGDDWGGCNSGGPDRMGDDEHADALGRRIMREPLPA